MSQLNSSRRHSQNINTDRVEYHYIADASKTIMENAATGYTFIPSPEAITEIPTQPKYIKVTGYHYRLLGTHEPNGQTWDSSNTFSALSNGGTYISVYETATASTPAYLKIGIESRGYKYYQKVNEDSYYELVGKMPNELEYGELGIGRSTNNEVMYIKNSDGQMVEFRSYKANTEYVDNEITDVYNLIYSIHYSPSWSVSPNVIFKSSSDPGTTCTATAKLSFNGTAESVFNASTPSEWTAGTTSGTTRIFTKSIATTNNTTTVSTTISKDAYSKSLSANISAVNHIYYGKSSSTDYKLLTGLTAYTTATTTANGRNYEVAMTSGDYFYIAVPSSVAAKPSQVGTGGEIGFFESLTKAGEASLQDSLTGVTETYEFYRTQSGQASGIFNYYVK